MASQFKRAHRTHALAQRAGEAYPGKRYPGAADASGDAGALDRFRELSARVLDPLDRARLLGVPPETIAAWDAGRAMPLLRAHRRTIERALRRLAAGP
jgi:hypothetical protein